MAAQISPDASKLAAAGIRRVVMAAGEDDMSAPTMKRALASLVARSIEVRWVSFGKIAHVWPRDFEERMREPLAWAAQRERP